MRIYIIGNDGITLCSDPPAAVNEGEIVVASKEELHAAPLSAKRLLVLWNALPSVEKRRKVGDRDGFINELVSSAQSSLSVFHQKLGLIISGANSKHQPELATFSESFGGATYNTPVSSRLQLGDKQDRLSLAYNTFFTGGSVGDFFLCLIFEADDISISPKEARHLAGEFGVEGLIDRGKNAASQQTGDQIFGADSQLLGEVLDVLEDVRGP